MNSAFITLVRRPKGINWPEPDHTVPIIQPPWVCRPIRLFMKDDSRRAISAFIYEEWAIHRMISYAGLDDGWTTSTHANGCRFTFGSRVFASAAGAMEMAERLWGVWQHFTEFNDREIKTLPPDVKATCSELFVQAERDGKILQHLVYV